MSAKRFFHWQYSGVLIPLFLCVAMVMLGLGPTLGTEDWPFWFAYLFFGTALTWTLGYWVTSDFVGLHNPLPTLEELIANKRVSTMWEYRGWLWFGLLSIVVLFLLSVSWVYTVQRWVKLNRRIGILVAARDSPEQWHCGSPRNTDLLLSLGTVQDSTSFFPYTFLWSGNERLLTIDKDKKGHIVLSTKIFGTDGKLLAKIEKGAFEVNEHIAHFDRPDESTLIVRDDWDKRVLYVRYANPTTVKLLGRFKIGGGVLVIDERHMYTEGPNVVKLDASGACFQEFGGFGF